MCRLRLRAEPARVCKDAWRRAFHRGLAACALPAAGKRAAESKHLPRQRGKQSGGAHPPGRGWHDHSALRQGRSRAGSAGGALASRSGGASRSGQPRADDSGRHRRGSGRRYDRRQRVYSADGAGGAARRRRGAKSIDSVCLRTMAGETRCGRDAGRPRDRHRQPSLLRLRRSRQKRQSGEVFRSGHSRGHRADTREGMEGNGDSCSSS